MCRLLLLLLWHCLQCMAVAFLAIHYCVTHFTEQPVGWIFFCLWLQCIIIAMHFVVLQENGALNESFMQKLHLHAWYFAILLPLFAHCWAAAATEVSRFIFLYFYQNFGCFFSCPNQKRCRDESAVFCIHSVKDSDAHIAFPCPSRRSSNWPGLKLRNENGHWTVCLQDTPPGTVTCVLVYRSQHHRVHWNPTWRCGILCDHWATDAPPNPLLASYQYNCLGSSSLFLDLAPLLALSVFLALSLSTSLSTPFPTNGQQRDEGWRTLKKKTDHQRFLYIQTTFCHSNIFFSV